MSTGLYVTPGLIDIHVHVYAGTGERRSYAGDNSVYPDGFTFRVGVTTVVDAGSSGWRNFDDFKDRIIDRVEDPRPRVPEHRRQRHARRQVRAEPGRHGGEAHGRDGAEASRARSSASRPRTIAGPEWTPVERAVEAGTMANIPVMVDFGANKPERPLAELVTKKLRPATSTRTATPDCAASRIRRAREPGSARRAQARRDLRRRARRRQLRLADRGAGHEGRLRAGLDLDRPAHRQHERRHEGHAERDGQVPRDGHVARRGGRAVHLEPGARDQARGSGPPVGRRRRRRRGAARGARAASGSST